MKEENNNSYTEENIVSLEDLTHVRLRPGMYIGRLGDGSDSADGMYILMKEVIDNSIDEFTMGNGKQIIINIHDKNISIRDFGRGVPFGSLHQVVSKLHSGGKFDDRTFKKSVGLNGVGLKAVNALSSTFRIQSFRDGQTVAIDYEKGIKVSSDVAPVAKKKKNGTLICFTPDESLFGPYGYDRGYIETM